MRTTIDIPDVLYRQIKARAASEGQSVKELVLRSVQAQLSASSTSRPSRRIQLPLIRASRPGTLRLDNKKIYDLVGFP